MIFPALTAGMLFFLILPAIIYGNSDLPVLEVNDNCPSLEIAANAGYFLDKTNTRTLEQILRENPPFTRHIRDSFQFTFEMSTLWIRFYVSTAPGQNRPFLAFDNIALGSITVFVPILKNGVPDWTTLKSSWSEPSLPGERSFLKTTFSLPDDIDSRRPILVRIYAPATMYFRATLYTPEAFRKHGINISLLIGFCLGVLAAMLLYNLVLFLFVRDRYYFFYILYVFFLLSWQSILLGLFRYLWPSWGGRMIRAVLPLGAGMLFFGIVFAVVFLNTRDTAPRHDKVLKILAAGIVAAMLLSFVGNFWTANYLIYFLAQISSLAVFSAAIASLRAGFRPARYYLVAVSVVLFAALIFFLRFYGLLPNNIFTMHAVLFGSAAESVLLSFALGHRIRLMRYEEERLRVSEKSLQAISITDDLTGLYNRRFLNAALSKSIASAKRTGATLSLLMLDVDHFKRYNDTYGHPQGDRVLMALGQLLTQSLRGGDVACRYGGEEFVIILNQTDRNTALEAAERIRSNFEQTPFQPLKNKTISMTVSIGVAQWLPGENPDQILQRADLALYEAKQSGRNRVCGYRKVEELKS